MRLKPKEAINTESENIWWFMEFASFLHLTYHMNRLISSSVKYFFFAIALSLSLLLIYNSLPYFRFDFQQTFLLEKANQLKNPLWTVAFFVHVAAAMVCLLTAIPQFSRKALKRWPAVHRWLGKIYIIAVLALAAPTGLYIALFAKGGYAGQSGFLLAGLLWWFTTWKGFITIRKGLVKEHIKWMIRSYALAATALTFRLIYVGLALNINIEIAYIAALWSSNLLNIVAGEWVIAIIRNKSGRKAPTRARPVLPIIPHPSFIPKTQSL